MNNLPILIYYALAETTNSYLAFLKDRFEGTVEFNYKNKIYPTLKGTDNYKRNKMRKFVKEQMEAFTHTEKVLETFVSNTEKNNGRTEQSDYLVEAIDNALFDLDKKVPQFTSLYALLMQTYAVGKIVKPIIVNTNLLAIKNQATPAQMEYQKKYMEKKCDRINNACVNLALSLPVLIVMDATEAGRRTDIIKTAFMNAKPKLVEKLA